MASADDTAVLLCPSRAKNPLTADPNAPPLRSSNSFRQSQSHVQLFDAISDARAASGDCPGPAEMADEHSNQWPLPFETHFSHLCRFRGLQSVDRSALC
ncbi:hypothetical protein CEXT_570391 [Caerostris extrusa]|uniref:Uncharacterized protein n=1 Tax=Caerostris extrusa TaxID=172846 RepID=A0AAV4PQP6_CAEEX|nr:hypothetical protein CEXT_570391 [Caerostris extrusa]